MRRLFHSAACLSSTLRRHVAASCALCDVEYDDWGSHSLSFSHVARHTVCTAMVSPERHEAIMKQMWEHIQLDFGKVDEVIAKKEARRRQRLASTLQYLVQQGLLGHSLITATAPAGRVDPEPQSSDDEVLVVSPKFSLLAAVGCSFAEREVLDRVARLFPAVEGGALLAITQFVLSQRHLVKLFQLVDLASVLTFPVKRLSNDERSAMLLSILGELQMYSRQPRSRNVADKAASDALVLNVLATHAMDNLLSELTHFVLQKIVDEGTPVWSAYNKQLSDISTVGCTVAEPQLSPAPSPAQPPVSVDLKELCALRTTPAPSLLPSVATSTTDLLRSLSLDATVPFNPVKNSQYAATLPRLLQRPKGTAR